MEIEFFGANCFRLKTKDTSIVIDDDLDKHGAKNITKEKDVLLVSSKAVDASKSASQARLVLESAGEFEVGDISIKGLQTRGHMDEEGLQTATVFQCIYANTTVTILGHVHPNLSDDVQELAGGTDILIVPVGGNGFTLDAVGATSAIKAIEPDVVIPSHYETKGLKFEVPPAPLEDFVKTSGLSFEQSEDSYKLGSSSVESGKTQLIVLKAK